MKKIITFIVLFTVGLGLFTAPVLAIDLGIDKAKNTAAGAGYDAAGTTETTLAQNIGSFIRAILTVSGVIFTCLVFYAGFLWMTARGDETQVEKSKDIIRGSVIGLVISLAAFGITNFVMNMVTGGAAQGGKDGKVFSCLSKTNHCQELTGGITPPCVETLACNVDCTMTSSAISACTDAETESACTNLPQCEVIK